MTRNECMLVLELPANASRDEIVKAYRQLVQVWHPDRFPNNPELRDKANTKLSMINEAYTILLETVNDQPKLFPYRDTEVTYSGNDQRIGRVPSGVSGLGKSFSIACVIELCEEGLTVLTTVSGRFLDVAAYPKETILGVETAIERLKKHDASLDSVEWSSEPLSAERLIVFCSDPENIIRNPIRVDLRFRNSYFSQLFLKRLQTITIFEPWRPPPPPSAAASQFASTASLSTSNRNPAEPSTIVLWMTVASIAVSLIFAMNVGTVHHSPDIHSRSEAAFIPQPDVTVQDKAVDWAMPVSVSSRQQEPLPALSSDSAFRQIKFEQDGKQLYGYTHLSYLAPNGFRVSYDKRLTVRSDWRIIDADTNSVVGVVKKGTRGIVTRRDGDDVVMQLALPSPLDLVRLKYWHVISDGDSPYPMPNHPARITGEGEHPVYNASGSVIARLSDGALVTVVESSNISDNDSQHQRRK